MPTVTKNDNREEVGYPHVYLGVVEHEHVLGKLLCWFLSILQKLHFHVIEKHLLPEIYTKLFYNALKTVI